MAILKKKKERIEQMLNYLEYYFFLKNIVFTKSVSNFSYLVKDNNTKDNLGIILIPNKSCLTKKKLLNERSNLVKYTIYINSIFYKDGKNFYQRMVDTNSSWRTDKSLKNYSSYEINQIIRLTDLERLVATNYDLYYMSEPEYLKNKILTYYQPQTQRLNDGIIKRKIKSVILDYDHIPQNERFTSEQELSKTYYFLKNV